MKVDDKFWVNKINGGTKLIISFILALITYLISAFQQVLHLVICWDVFSLCLLSLIWITFFTSSSQSIRTQAQKQDDSRIIFFILAILASILSMFSVLQMIIVGPGNNSHQNINLIVVICCMVLSWLLVHSIFAIRYAHYYYSKDKNDKKPHAGGLEFPGKDDPDFLDFAYYSLTIGMTFQVSDVEISSRKIRHLSLIHGLFSFGFNATIIALGVNIISSLISK